MSSLVWEAGLLTTTHPVLTAAINSVYSFVPIICYVTVISVQLQ